jgi:membrane protease YdiL (CAAX protease family)
MQALVGAAALALLVIVALGASGRMRWIGREFPTAVRLAGGFGSLWAVLIAAVAMPAVVSSSRGGLEAGDLSFPTLFIGHAVLVGFLVVWWSLRRPIRPARFLYLSGARVDDLAGGTLLGVRVWGITLGVALVAGLILQLGLSGIESATPADIDVPELPDVLVWMVDLPVGHKLLIVLAAMTVEEAFFRAFLQSRIGLLPSSLLFAFAHASYGLPTLMIGVFVVSIVIGRDFARHGRLLRCIMAHGVFDAIQLLIVVPYAVRQLQLMQAVL